MANTTRSGLVAARISEVEEKPKKSGKFIEKAGGISVACMFNPFEYSVSKSNTYSEEPGNKSNVPQVTFQKAGAQTLKLALTFDTYETSEEVSQITNKLWKLMEPRQRESNGSSGKKQKLAPPDVAFEWGVFRFVAVITSMTQKFTLFTDKGTPVRAQVDVTFTQHKDLNDYPGQNPTSGGGPAERVHQVKAGDRLDTIAADIYGDATRWSLIARHNSIDNPLALRPGQQLNIPFD